MNGVLCLQGGREFTPPCAEMDRVVLSLARGSGVAVLAGAARPGADYDGASDRARRHYERLGAVVDIVPDPRHDEAAALDRLTPDIDLLVLPGGSPSSLLTVLSGAIGNRMVELHHAGMAISGASAGAMVLCESMIQPDQSAALTNGLGLLEGLALPHWSPGRTQWDVPDTTLWGLPECGGIVVANGAVSAVGRGEAARCVSGSWTPLPRH